MSLSAPAKLAFFFLALMTAALGCEPPPEGPSIADQEQPIVNGSLDPDHPAVGLLLMNAGGSTSHCTATLIGSRTVLTAAHCLSQSGSYTFEVAGRQIQVDERVWHQDFTKTGSIPGYANAYLNDLGLATLAEEVSDIPPVLLSYPQPSEGMTVKVVGLGMTAPNTQETLGERQITTSTIGTLGDDYYIYGMKIDPSGGNPCYGDSGGPTFVERFGRDHLLGIHSMGDEACSAYGYDMLLSAYASWINSKAGSNLGVSGIDADPPLILITSPAEGAAVPPSFAVEVVALDDRSGLSRIELSLDGQPRGESSASPASFPLEGVSEGAHQLTVEATDQLGRSAEAKLELTVDVNASPDPSTRWTGLNDPELNDDYRVEVVGSCAAAAGGEPALPLVLALLALLLGLPRKR